MIILKTVIDLLYPRRCPVCHRIIPTNNNLVCTVCRPRLTYVKEPICKKCGKPIEDSLLEYCFDCSRYNQYYDEGRAAFVYDNEMKQSIYQFKYNDKREYVEFYATEIIKALKNDINRWNADALIPVPIHRKRKKIRGFNQSFLLAREMGQCLQIPVVNDMIIRDKNTLPQKELSFKERQINLKNAFKIVQNDVKLNSIILVDDIYTTGNTINEVAKVCRQAGINKIYFICIAIGRGI